jgi:two-component system response regulator CpxR
MKQGGTTMSSIALFPCLPTLESGIIGELSSILTLKVYTDENLLGDAVALFGCNAGRLRKMVHGRTSVFNQFTLEKEKTVNLLRLILADKLSEPEQYLFHGFLTSLIPPQVSEVLRVAVVDTKENRIARSMGEGLSQWEAKKSIHTQDVSAFSWTDFLFNKEAYDSSLYDLVIPVEKRDHRKITKDILGCFHKTSVLRTPQSQQAVQNMKLAAESERVLLENGHKLDIISESGTITLHLQDSVLNFGDLQSELSELVKQVAGVSEVTVEESKSYADSIYRQQKFELPSKVLFVDDEREFVKTVSQRLISRDVGTYGVYDGKQALDLIVEDQPEVMVLDLKMPGLHGVEVLRRTKDVAPEIEVIILTGHGTTRDMEECMKLGAFAYMNKPVNIEELSVTIKAANDKVHARIEQ